MRHMTERIWSKPVNGVMKSSIGDKLAFGDDPKQRTEAADIQAFLSHLPENLRTYTLECLEEHSPIVDFLLTSGYEFEELSYKDYLSWPYGEISWDDVELLQEAFDDVRYELIPTIRFWNAKTENPEDDTVESSALTIEFHKRGMAF